jgi:hypothetical protein
MSKEIKIGDVVNPLEIGQRSFDPKELFNALRKNRIVWCWGAQAWTIHKDKFLRFKSNGYLHKGHVYITLGWNDTFTIIYTSLKGKVIDIQEDIYIDMLVEAIDRKIETK